MDDMRVRMSADEQKSVMLQILIAFAKYCEEHSLTYFLDAGTLLGAVRHKGYIPWDDDIDVNMPRQSYDRFCELAKSTKGYIAPHLYVEFPEDTIFPFLKVSDDRTVLVEYPDKNPMEVGVYMDVFPKDGIKDDSVKSKFVCDTSYRLNLWRWFNVFSVHAWKSGKHWGKRALAAIGRKMTKDPNLPLLLQQKWIERNRKRNPLESCKYVTTLVNGEFHKRAPRSYFDDTILLEFENNYFCAPKEYDGYLRCLYPGDYMQLPPEDQRVSHDTIVFWKSQEDKVDFINQER